MFSSAPCASADEKPEATTTEEHQSGGNNSENANSAAANSAADVAMVIKEEPECAADNEGGQHAPAMREQEPARADRQETIDANTARGCSRFIGCNPAYQFRPAHYERHIIAVHSATREVRFLAGIASDELHHAGIHLTPNFSCSRCDAEMPSCFGFLAHCVKQHDSAALFTQIPAQSLEPYWLAHIDRGIVPRDFLKQSAANHKAFPGPKALKRGYCCRLAGCDERLEMDRETICHHFIFDHWNDVGDVRAWRQWWQPIIEHLSETFRELGALDNFECPIDTEACRNADSVIGSPLDLLRHVRKRHPELLREVFRVARIPAEFRDNEPPNVIDVETLFRGAGDEPRASDEEVTPRARTREKPRGHVNQKLPLAEKPQEEPPIEDGRALRRQVGVGHALSHRIAAPAVDVQRQPRQDISQQEQVAGALQAKLLREVSKGLKLVCCDLHSVKTYSDGAQAYAALTRFHLHLARATDNSRARDGEALPSAAIGTRNGMTPHTCFCGKKYHDAEALKEHKRFIHCSNAPSVCAQCHIVFKRIDYLEKHLARGRCRAQRKRKANGPMAARPKRVMKKQGGPLKKKRRQMQIRPEEEEMSIGPAEAAPDSDEAEQNAAETSAPDAETTAAIAFPRIPPVVDSEFLATVQRSIGELATSMHAPRAVTDNCD